MCGEEVDEILDRREGVFSSRHLAFSADEGEDYDGDGCDGSRSWGDELLGGAAKVGRGIQK